MINRARHARAFSLVEMLVVLALVGMLAMLATYTTQSYSLRVRRVVAHDALLKVAHAQALYRSSFNDYASSIAVLGLADLPAAHYVIALDTTAAPGFRVSATPVGRQQRDRCGTLAIDHTGRRTVLPLRTLAADVGNCW
jgi:type IV pilus assembly protein PilE